MYTAQCALIKAQKSANAKDYKDFFGKKFFFNFFS